MKSILGIGLFSFLVLGIWFSATAINRYTTAFDIKNKSFVYQKRCLSWERVCTPAASCLSAACWLCQRHVTSRGGKVGLTQTRTCYPESKGRLESRGWTCHPQVNSRGRIDSQQPHCAVGDNICKYTCTRWEEQS